MTKLAICLPSRGLIHSRTIEAVQRAVAFAQGPDLTVLPQWFITHNLPYPDGTNDTIERALAAGVDLVWMLEEDNVPTEESLHKLLGLIADGCDIAFEDYPVGNYPGPHYHCFHRKLDGSGFWFTGIGCTLIKAEVFAKVARPWYDSSKQVMIVRNGTRRERRTVVDRPAEYGSADVVFGVKANEAGFRIGVTFGGGHCWLEEWGQKWHKDGCHQILVRTEVTEKTDVGV